MKKSLFLFAAGLVTLQGSAMACPRTQSNLICTRDAVVDESNREGTVTAINPHTRMAAVRIDAFNIVTVPIQSLALKEGCTGGACVGDRVVDASRRTGEVIAVNPFNHKIAIRLNHFDIITVNVDSIAVELPGTCIGPVCSDAEVIDSNNRKGRVIGLNRYNNTAAVRLNSFDVILTSVTELATLQGCLSGVCAEDAVVDAANREARVLGINFFQGMAAIQLNHFDVITVPVNTLSITNYCDKYAELERSNAIQTSVPSPIAVSQTATQFDFHMNRQ